MIQISNKKKSENSGNWKVKNIPSIPVKLYCATINEIRLLMMLYLPTNSFIEKKNLEFFQKINCHTQTHTWSTAERGASQNEEERERRYRSQARSSFLPSLRFASREHSHFCAFGEVLDAKAIAGVLPLYANACRKSERRIVGKWQRNGRGFWSKSEKVDGKIARGVRGCVDSTNTEEQISVNSERTVQIDMFKGRAIENGNLIYAVLSNLQIFLVSVNYIDIID